jgi:hypothetical protein
VLSEKLSVKKAAESLDLKFSTAKTILKIFKEEGRVGKKKNRSRNALDSSVIDILHSMNFLNRSYVLQTLHQKINKIEPKIELSQKESRIE